MFKFYLLEYGDFFILPPEPNSKETYLYVKTIDKADSPGYASQCNSACNAMIVSTGEAICLAGWTDVVKVVI